MSAQLNTPLSKAKGSGAAHEGTAHWLLQRLTSVALVPIVLWLSFSVAMLPNLRYEALEAWLQQPLVTILVAVSIITVCYHQALGLRVIIEDYVHINPLKVAGIIAMNVWSILLTIGGIYAVIKIAL